MLFPPGRNFIKISLAIILTRRGGVPFRSFGFRGLRILKRGAAVLGAPVSRGRAGVLSGRLGLQTGGAGVKWEICFFWFKNCRLRA